jgi:hypothetical protein
MTEYTKPPRPEQSPIVARYWELYRAFHDGRTSLDHLVSRDRKNNQPNTDLIGRLDPEQWSYSDHHPEIRFSQAERVAEYERRAEERIAEIRTSVANAQALADYLEEHRAEIEAYQTAEEEWREACREIDRLESEARQEEWREKQRARHEVGKWVRPFRARNYWEIIARTGKGGIIREIRHDDKPARVRELADILEVA